MNQYRIPEGLCKINVISHLYFNEKMNDKYNNLFIGIILILIFGFSFGYTSFLLCLLVLIIRLFTSDKNTVGIFLLMYGGVLGGILRLMYPLVPLYGLLLNFIGIVLLWGTLRDLFIKKISSLLFILFVFVVFGICYLYGPKTEFASEKYFTMLQNGILMLFGYYVLFNSKDYSPAVLSQMLFISAILLMSFDITYYHMNPGALFDFNWFRQQETDYFYSNDRSGFIVSYQEIGVLALIGTAIYLSQVSLKRAQIPLYILPASMVILISGARQAIFGLVGVLILRYAIFNKCNMTKKHLGKLLLSFVSVLILLIIAIYLLPLLNIDVVNSTLQSGDEGRLLLYVEALNMFNDNTMFGIGFGGFEHYTFSDQPWPHNFILEILCESGLFGLISLSILVYIYFTRNKCGIMTMTNQGMFYFLIIFANLMSFMVSADFRLSISIFSSLFVVRKTTASFIKI